VTLGSDTAARSIPTPLKTIFRTRCAFLCARTCIRHRRVDRMSDRVTAAGGRSRPLRRLVTWRKSRAERGLLVLKAALECGVAFFASHPANYKSKQDRNRIARSTCEETEYSGLSEEMSKAHQNHHSTHNLTIPLHRKRSTISITFSLFSLSMSNKLQSYQRYPCLMLITKESRENLPDPQMSF